MNAARSLPVPWALDAPAAVRRALLPAALAAALAGCAGPAAPPLQWLRLPAEPPAAPPLAGRSAATPSGPWQLVLPVALPGHLDRDALLVPRGAAALQPLAGVRWAEPLRDAVPRLLRQDLARMLAAPVWTAPLPPGVPPPVQLRLELAALDVAADGRGVLLQARWSLADAAGARPPRLAEAAFTTPAADGSADALALAHRAALAELARRIVAAAGS